MTELFIIPTTNKLNIKISQTSRKLAWIFSLDTAKSKRAKGVYIIVNDQALLLFNKV